MKRFPIGYQSDRVRYSSVSYGGVKKHLNFFQRFRQHLRNATRRNVTNGVIVVFNGFSCYEKLMRKHVAREYCYVVYVGGLNVKRPSSEILRKRIDLKYL